MCGSINGSASWAENLLTQTYWAHFLMTKYQGPSEEVQCRKQSQIILSFFQYTLTPYSLNAN